MIQSIPGRPEAAQLCVTHPSAQTENQASLSTSKTGLPGMGLPAFQVPL